MENEQLIFFAGFFNIFCALLHLLFPIMFQWNRIVSSLYGEDKRMLQVNLHIMNGCLFIFFIIFAVLSLRYPAELVNTSLGKTLLASFVIFWIIRSAAQAVLIAGAVLLRDPAKIIGGNIAGMAFFLTGVSLYLVPLVQVI